MKAETEVRGGASPCRRPDSRGWRLAAAQERGTSHETKGEVCQDAYGLAMPSPEVLIIAIADGAGSAKYAEVGAGIAASRGVAQLCARLAEEGADFGDAELKNILREGLVAAREAVEAGAAALDAGARDLATTLILIIARPELVAVSQIGDGATVIANEEGEIIALTSPPVGEYVNEATFLTSSDALSTAQTILWRGRAAQLAAFSDGLQLLCLKWPECLPHEAFFAPLFKFIRTAADEVQAESELVSFLGSERIKELTDDDLTLVLASVTDSSGGR
ncbi:MAG: PP2C family serine/threonine-protein phosphatase [Pyrinomonadaceae bacterium]